MAKASQHVTYVLTDIQDIMVTSNSTALTRNMVHTVSFSLTVAAILLLSSCIVDVNSARSCFITSSTDDDCQASGHIHTASQHT